MTTGGSDCYKLMVAARFPPKLMVKLRTLRGFVESLGKNGVNKTRDDFFC